MTSHLSAQALAIPLHRRRSAGFSIIELMVAMALSLMLMMGVAALFTSTRSGYETTERLSRIQENGGFALMQMVSDLRMTGFQGCARPMVNATRAQDYAITTLNTPNALLWNFAIPAQGFEANGDGSWSPALDPVITNPATVAPDVNSDVLVLRVPRRGAVPLRLTAPQGATTNPLLVDVVNPAPLQANDIAMVTDCMARAYFQVRSYVGGQITHEVGGGGAMAPGNATDDLRHPFLRGSEVVPMDTVIYYARTSTAEPTRLSLWRKIGANVPEEIAEGIERFEVQYGVDNVADDGRVDVYVNAGVIDADPAIDWDDVMSVSIALLARSLEAHGQDLDTETYTLLDRNVGPFNDRHQRQVFMTTVALRNVVID